MNGFKESAVIGIFGHRATAKLKSWLSECCKPYISVNFCATCNGVDNFGNPTYNVAASITYNISISGYTALTYWNSTQPLPNAATPFVNINSSAANGAGVSLSNTYAANQNTGTFIVGAITAGVPVISENVTVDNTQPGNYYLMVTDNRGNYSNPIMVNFPNCS